jgi:hypothetical protein
LFRCPPFKAIVASLNESDNSNPERGTNHVEPGRRTCERDEHGMSCQIAIFSLKDELHALVAQDALRRRGVTCHFVATNDLLENGGLVWSRTGSARLRSDEGEWFEVGELDAIWWRRAYPQQLPRAGVDRDDILRFATIAWRSALLGARLSDFRGAWINDPYAGGARSTRSSSLAPPGPPAFAFRRRTSVRMPPACVRSAASTASSA